MKNKHVQRFAQHAKRLNLDFIIQEPIQPKEPVLAIVNKCTDAKRLESLTPPLPPKQTLTVVSRKRFSKKYGFTWTDKVFSSDKDQQSKKWLDFLESNAKSYIERARLCEKVLILTDHGFATGNLTPIKKGEPVAIYEGEFSITNDVKSSDYREKLHGQKSTRSIPDQKTTPKLYVLELYYNEEKNKLFSVDAEKYKGFGVFMQSLIKQEEQKYYRIKGEQQIALANLIPCDENLLFPCLKAEKDIPPLSLLGTSYKPDYFLAAGIPFVPFGQDGFSVPYEVAIYTINFINNMNLTCENPLIQEFSDQEINEILEKISKNKVTKFKSVYLKEEEAKQIRSKISGKIMFFTVEISKTPDIIPIRQAAIYCTNSYGFSSFLSSESDSRNVQKLSKYIESDVLDTFQQVDLISKKESKDFENSEIPAWFQYLYHQSLYFISLNKLLKIILQSSDKIPNDIKIERMLNKYKCKAKEKSAPKQYPVTFRNAAANFQISDLFFLIKENKAINYINDRSEDLKTALHIAVESKKGNKNKEDQLATCLLLLECKADPSLPDKEEQTAKHLVKNNPVLSLLFKRMERIDRSEPDEVVKQIKEKAAKLGFGGDF